MFINRTNQFLKPKINSASFFINSVGVGFLAVMMFLTATDVILRYVFNRPITGSLELTELMMAIVVSFALAYAAVKNEHVNIDLITSRLPPKPQAALNTITSCLCFGVFALIAWRTVLYAEHQRLGNFETMSLQIPVYPFVYVVAFGCAVLCLVFLCNILENVTRLIENSRWWESIGLLLVVALVLMAFAAPVVGREVIWYISPLQAGFFGIFLLVLMLFSGMPIGIVMAVVGFIGLAYVAGVEPSLTSMGSSPHTTSSSYSLSVVPLFVLMGAFCFHSGLSRDLYSTVYKWLGHLPGGLAMATVGACAGFAAVSGSSVATVATMGTVALPEMKRYDYDVALAAGSIAAGGSIGILIPPSVILVIYAILAEQSVGKLFLAGFIPGILEALFYMVTIYIICHRNPVIGPRGEKFSLIDKVISLKGTWGVIVLFLLVIGGLYMGVFTPTEAAGAGAFGAFLFTLGRKKLTWENFTGSLIETGKTTAMVFVILIGANILGYFLAVTRLPFDLSNFMANLPINRYFVLLGIILIYLILGAIMSSMAMIVLTVPIFFPIITALGFDPIWFGILIVRVVELGQITPPIGINVFVVKAIAKDVPMYTVFRGIIPFLIADFCHVALLIAFPQIALLLPNLMG
ncbi:MAG: TRAP transporter large permease subunit [Deltaproteobacteria bacterium]|nr:TRAP transporter large permease subunit [Deltaproteobacteria bacterium]